MYTIRAYKQSALLYLPPTHLIFLELTFKASFHLSTKVLLCLVRAVSVDMLFYFSSTFTVHYKQALMNYFMISCFQWWQVDKISPIKLYDENKTVSGFCLRTLLFRQGRHELAREIVNKLFKLYSDGRIRPRIDSAWAFEDVSTKL